MVVEAEQRAGPWVLRGEVSYRAQSLEGQAEEMCDLIHVFSGSFGSYVGNGKLGEMDGYKEAGSHRDNGEPGQIKRLTA